MDMGRVARDVVDEMAAARPNSILKLETSGDLRGEWDSPRISQVISNLLANAVQHGASNRPITVKIEGEPDHVMLCVHNYGPPIPPSDLHGLFSPLKRLRSGELAPHDSSNLGLGLYIAERIVTAHVGSIEVRSSEEEGTSFTVRLPRGDGIGILHG
jgi:signal transduction histidine kinase